MQNSVNIRAEANKLLEHYAGFRDKTHFALDEFVYKQNQRRIQTPKYTGHVTKVTFK